MAIIRNLGKESDEEPRKMVGFKKIFIPYFIEGEYKFKVEQEINIKNDKNEDAAFDNIEDELEFAIMYDRFNIKLEDIHSRYPNEYSAEDFSLRIPQITFLRESIPWERRLKINDMLYHKYNDEKYKIEALPWIALMVFAEDDKVITRSMPAKDAFNEGINRKNKIYTPKNILDYDENGEVIPRLNETLDTTCTVVDIPIDLFRAIMPDIDNLKYMAHVRCVDVENKETKYFVTDGRYSSIIANRFPKKSEGEISSIEHEVHVVSLEGFDDYLYNGNVFEGENQPGFDYTHVRMISTYRWKFTNKCKNTSGFNEIVEKLDTGYMGDYTENIRDDLKKMLTTGYRPLNHLTREGNKTVSWYKSPLIPYLPSFTADNKNVYYDYECLNNSDAALSYISDNHMLDTTYASAWTIGRLMALQNQAFLSEIYDLRIRNYVKDSKIRNINLLSDLLFEQEIKEQEDIINNNESNEDSTVEQLDNNIRKFSIDFGKVSAAATIKAKHKVLDKKMQANCCRLINRFNIQQKDITTDTNKSEDEKKSELEEFVNGIKIGTIVGCFNVKKED